MYCKICKIGLCKYQLNNIIIFSSILSLFLISSNSIELAFADDSQNDSMKKMYKKMINKIISKEKSSETKEEPKKTTPEEPKKTTPEDTPLENTVENLKNKLNILKQNSPKEIIKITKHLIDYKILYQKILNLEEIDVKSLKVEFREILSEEKFDDSYYDKLDKLSVEYHEIRQKFHTNFDNFQQEVKILQKNSAEFTANERKLIKKMELLNKDFNSKSDKMDEKNEKEFLIFTTILNSIIKDDLIQLKNQIAQEKLKLDKSSIQKLNDLNDKKEKLNEKLIENNNKYLKFQFIKNDDFQGFKKELEKQEDEQKEKVKKEKEYREQVKKESEKRKENNDKGNSDKGNSGGKNN